MIMLRGGLLLLLLMLALVATAAEPWTVQLAECDPVVRHGMIWRCRITGEIPLTRFADGPFVAQVSLTQGDNTLATQDFSLERLGQLLGGISVVLVPTPPLNRDAAVELTVTVSDRSRRDLQHISRRLPTPLTLQRGLEQRQRRLGERAEQDPLPALWLEQAGELVIDGPSLATCHKLIEIGDRLDRWLAGERVPQSLRAMRDPRDGSAHPYRLHVPNDGALTSLVVMLVEPARPLRKCAWPTIPETWLSATRAAGCAVLEVYPAGDSAWNGIARQRVWTTISAAIAAEPRLTDLPVALVGSGRGAEAAVALAEEQPWRLRAIGLIDANLPSSTALPVEAHARWQALQRAGERPAHILGLNLVLADPGNPATRAWSQRLTLAGCSPVFADGGATQAAFWQALTSAPTTATAARRDYLVLAPMKLGRLHIDELSEWGVAGSLTEEAGNVRTSGIARLRSDAPLPALVDGQPYRAPGASLPAPRKQLGQATGPLAAYADGAFTVVIGTGESAAAQADNRTLGQAFAAAWATHAQGRVRLMPDTGLDETALPGQHLVLIGNLRSNLLLARLTARAALPVQWDARTLTIGSEVFLRSDRRAFALAWPHPAHDGRLLVILDGGPSWSATGLPLAGLPDLLVGGRTANDQPAVLRTFGNDWR